MRKDHEANMRKEAQKAMQQAIHTSRYTPEQMLRRIDRELKRLENPPKKKGV